MFASKKDCLTLGCIFLVVTLVLFYLSSTSQKPSTFSSRTYPDIFWKKGNYEENCINLYKKLRFPNMSLFFNPALQKPPDDLMDEFTQHGEMPIKKWWYFNEVYSDSKGDNTQQKRVINKSEIDNLRNKVNFDSSF